MFGIPSNVLIAVIGVLVLVLMNTNALSYVKSFLSKKTPVLDTAKEVLEEVVNPNPTVPMTHTTNPVAQRNPEIYEIVEQWDILRRMCEKAKLLESVKSLDSVFLNLLKKVESDEKDAS